MSDLPLQGLQGLRVLDFGQGVAGPYCGQLLADQGAQVLKIEPPRGDWSRTMGASDTAGMSGTFVSVNRNKRGLCLDLRQPEALRVVRRLADKADVVIESFRPGVMERLGLGAQALREKQPWLIFCSITGFGADGPNVDLPAGDSTMQAYGGLMSIVGERGGEPLRVGNVVSDMLAGVHAFSSVLLALLERAGTGRGQDVRIALLDAIVAFQAPPLTEYLMTGQLPQRLGNQHPLICPSGVVRARDGLLTLTVFDHQWAMFCAGLGHPQWADDERFASSASRQRHRDALNELMAPVFLSRGKEEWLGLLRTLDVLSAPINDYPGLLADPQVRHSGLIGRALGADGTAYPSIRNPVRMAAAEPRRDVAAPRLGEHTREILRSECGFTDAEVEDLLARGAAQAPEITQPAGEFQ